MSDSFSNFVYTTAKIAKIWGGDWTADKISKKFGSILKQLDISKR